MSEFDLDQFKQELISRDRPEEVPPERNLFTDSLKRGVDQTAMLYDAATGDDEGVFLRQRELMGNPPQVPSLDEVHGLGDLGKYAVERLVENAPMLGAMAASGGVGGAVGGAVAKRVATGVAERALLGRAAAPALERLAAQKGIEGGVRGLAKEVAAARGSRVGGLAGQVASDFPLQYGEEALQQKDAGVDHLGTRLGVAAINTVLDVAAFDRLLGLTFGRSANKQLAADAARNLADQYVKKGWVPVVKQAGKAGALGALAEVPSEVGQTITSIAARASYDPTFDPFGPEAQKQIREAVASAAIVGSALPAAGAGVRTSVQQLADFTDQLESGGDVSAGAQPATRVDGSQVERPRDAFAEPPQAPPVPPGGGGGTGASEGPFADAVNRASATAEQVSQSQQTAGTPPRTLEQAVAQYNEISRAIKSAPDEAKPELAARMKRLQRLIVTLRDRHAAENPAEDARESPASETPAEDAAEEPQRTNAPDFGGPAMTQAEFEAQQQAQQGATAEEPQRTNAPDFGGPAMTQAEFEAQQQAQQGATAEEPQRTNAPDFGGPAMTQAEFEAQQQAQQEPKQSVSTQARAEGPFAGAVQRANAVAAQVAQQESSASKEPTTQPEDTGPGGTVPESRDRLAAQAHAYVRKERSPVYADLPPSDPTIRDIAMEFGLRPIPDPTGGTWLVRPRDAERVTEAMGELQQAADSGSDAATVRDRVHKDLLDYDQSKVELVQNPGRVMARQTIDKQGRVIKEELVDPEVAGPPANNQIDTPIDEALVDRKTDYGELGPEFDTEPNTLELPFALHVPKGKNQVSKSQREKMAIAAESMRRLLLREDGGGNSIAERAKVIEQAATPTLDVTLAPEFPRGPGLPAYAIQELVKAFRNGVTDPNGGLVFLDANNPVRRKNGAKNPRVITLNKHNLRKFGGVLNDNTSPESVGEKEANLATAIAWLEEHGLTPRFENDVRTEEQRAAKLLEQSRAAKDDADAEAKREKAVEALRKARNKAPVSAPYNVKSPEEIVEDKIARAAPGYNHQAIKNTLLDIVPKMFAARDLRAGTSIDEMIDSAVKTLVDSGAIPEGSYRDEGPLRELVVAVMYDAVDKATSKSRKRITPPQPGDFVDAQYRKARGKLVARLRKLKGNSQHRLEEIQQALQNEHKFLGTDGEQAVNKAFDEVRAAPAVQQEEPLAEAVSPEMEKKLTAARQVFEEAKHAVLDEFSKLGELAEDAPWGDFRELREFANEHDGHHDPGSKRGPFDAEEAMAAYQLMHDAKKEMVRLLRTQNKLIDLDSKDRQARLRVQDEAIIGDNKLAGEEAAQNDGEDSYDSNSDSPSDNTPASRSDDRFADNWRKLHTTRDAVETLEIQQRSLVERLRGAKTEEAKLEVLRAAGKVLSEKLGTARIALALHRIFADLGITSSPWRLADDTSIDALNEIYGSVPENATALKQLKEDAPLGRTLFLKDPKSPDRVHAVIYLDTSRNHESIPHRLLHEAGHVLMAHHFNSMSAEERKAFDYLGDTPHVFLENFANAFAHAVLTGRIKLPTYAQVEADLEVAAAQSRSKARQFLQKVSKAFRKLYQAFRDEFGQAVPAKYNQFVKEWIGAWRESVHSSFIPAKDGPVVTLDYTPKPGQKRIARQRVKNLLTKPASWARIAKQEAWEPFSNVVVKSFDTYLRDNNLTWLADFFHHRPGTVPTRRGAVYEAQVRMETAPWLSRLEKIAELIPGERTWLERALRRGENHPDVVKTREELIAGKEPSTEFGKQLKQLYDDMYKWARAHGINVGYVKNFFPTIYSPEKLQVPGAHDAAVKAITDAVLKYNETVPEEARISDPPGYAENLYNKLAFGEVTSVMTHGGEEVMELLAPGFQSSKHRKLPAEVRDALANFREDDPVEVTTRYIDSLVRRAKWQERFGLNDEIAAINQKYEAAFSREDYQRADAYKLERLQYYRERYDVDLYDPSAKLLVKLQDEERAGRITPAARDWVLKKVLPAYQRRLGAEFSPWLKRASSLVTTYEAVRLLATGILSQFVDLGVVMYRTRRPAETMGTAFKLWASALANRGEYKKLHGMAEMVGAIRHDLTEHALIDATNAMTVGGKARRVNELFFRLNGMHGWANMTRVLGLIMGRRMIQQLVKEGDAKELERLGVSLEEAHAWVVDGMPLEYSNQHSNALGAINQLIDEQVLRPEAPVRPLIGNDQRFAVLWQLKGFIWAFHEQVLRRVAADVKDARGLQKVMPVVTLAALTLPLAMAGMELRWWLIPPYRRPEFGSFGYFSDAFQRTGMLGISQILADMVEATHFGRSALVSPFGPAATQIESIMTHDVSYWAPKAMPLQQIWKGIDKNFIE